MDPTIIIDERVDVAVLFRKNGDISTLAFPYKMKFHGQEITFTQLGFRHPTSQGKRMIHIYNVSDGINDYRLEFDAEHLIWTLKSILPGGSEL